MSRTYRHRHKKDTSTFFTDYFWVLQEWDCSSYHHKKVRIDPKSKEGKKKLALFKAIPYRSSRGPGWCINQFVQKPYRVKSKTEISNFIKNSDYEVIIESKPKRPWWD